MITFPQIGSYYLQVIVFVVILGLSNDIYVSAQQPSGTGCSSVLLSSPLKTLEIPLTTYQKNDIAALYTAWNEFNHQKTFNTQNSIVFTWDFYNNKTALKDQYGYYGMRLFNNSAIKRAFEIYNTTMDEGQFAKEVSQELEIQRRQLSKELACFNAVRAMTYLVETSLAMYKTISILGASEIFLEEHREKLDEIRIDFELVEKRRTRWAQTLETDGYNGENYESLRDQYDKIEVSVENLIQKVEKEEVKIAVRKDEHESGFARAMVEMVFTMFRAYSDPYSYGGDVLREFTNGKAFKELASARTVDQVVRGAQGLMTLDTINSALEFGRTIEGQTSYIYGAMGAMHKMGSYFTTQQLEELADLKSKMINLHNKTKDAVDSLIADDKFYRTRVSTRYISDAL